jgi:general stress protein 26
MIGYKLSASSVWAEDQINGYLDTIVLPCRLASIDKNGFPQVTSMWFLHSDKCIYLSARSKSLTCTRIKRNNKVGFEIAGENPPYSGVRGKGTATLIDAMSKPVLETLIEKYLGSTDSSLAKWLLSNPQSESTIKIVPEWITSWDYSNRMN